MKAPKVSKLDAYGTTPKREIRPHVGLNPTTPQNAAGFLIESPVSLPKAKGTTPLPTIAALPPEEPPEIDYVFHGLVTGPVKALLLVPPIASSSILVFPTIIVLCSFNLLTAVAL